MSPFLLQHGRLLTNFLFENIGGVMPPSPHQYIAARKQFVWAFVRASPKTADMNWGGGMGVESMSKIDSEEYSIIIRSHAHAPYNLIGDYD